MLADIKPHLENVAYRDAVPSDNAAKNAFPISGNACVDIHFRFFCISRKAEVCALDAEGGGLLIHPALFALTSIGVFSVT
jgi:hypothetical protein